MHMTLLICNYDENGVLRTYLLRGSYENTKDRVTVWLDEPCGDCYRCDPPQPDFTLGRILPNNDRPVSLNDAIEILKHLAKMPSVLTLGSQESQQRAMNAALITAASKKSGEPGLGDVLEILKRMANMNSMVPPYVK